MEKNRGHFKLIIIIAVFVGLITASTAVQTSAAALNYQYFDNPSAITSDGSSLYVADGDKLHSFSLDGFSHKGSKQLIHGDADSIHAYGGTVYTIEDGDIYGYSDTSDTVLIDGAAYNGFTSVYADSGYIYAAAGTRVYLFDASTLVFVKYLFGAAGQISHFAVLSDTVYASVPAMNGRRSNIYSQKTESGTAEPTLENTGVIYGLAALQSENTLVVLYGDAIKYFKSGISMLFETATFEYNDALKICASENAYVLSGAGSVLKFSKDLSSFSEVLAYRSAADGFYDNPVDITTRFNKTFVADRDNNRIAVYDAKQYTSLSPLIRPAAVAVNGAESVFAAHAENKLAMFDKSGKLVSDNVVKIQSQDSLRDLDAAILDVKFDGRENLFLLTRTNKLYVKTTAADTFSPAECAEFTDVYAIDAPSGGMDMLALTDSGIVRLGFDASGITATLNAGIDTTNAIDFAADADGSVYILKPANILNRYERNGETYRLAYSGAIDGAVSVSKIAVSTINNDYAKFRDVLALDTIRNVLKVISHTDLGVNYSDPAQRESLPASFKTALGSSVNLVRTITRDGGCDVYAQRSEVSPFRSLPKGFKVLVPEFDPDEKFTKIICDTVNVASGTLDEPLTVGYVNTSYLSDALPYSGEHADNCTVWLHPISVYSLPSRQAPKLEGFESVEKNTPLALLDFVSETRDEKTVYGYKDNFPDINGSIWYRVKILSGGTDFEGFVLAANVSVLGGNPDLSVRPQTNAVIIAKSKDNPDLGAYAYYYNDESGEYEIDTRYGIIAVGTKVEVVGAFDSTEPFTKILFYSAYGTVEVFVDTDNIKYQGVNVVQVVAIVIICLSVLLIIFLILRRLKKQRDKVRK